MDNTKKIKVVWLCSFSDEKLRRNLIMPKWYWANILRKVLRMRSDIDNAIWDTNARNIMEYNTDVELHIIAPHSGVAKLNEFEQNGICYHIFWKELDIITEKFKRSLNLLSDKSFPGNRKVVAKLIREIQPDIIHVIGAENFFYSISTLDIPRNIPVIVQLQTLISEDRFRNNYEAGEKQYQTVTALEQKILNRADYIGTMVPLFRERINSALKPGAVFVDTTLPLTEPVCTDTNDKEFDFVYFAADISKAADWAIEAFAIARIKHPEITLDVVGGYSPEYKTELDKRITELGVADAITFEGKLSSHEDVLAQIRKSRFALLPLKIDLISGTIRESMANGLPVITTITPDTPGLNKDFESVLLSPGGNYFAMADNMIRLIEDSEYAVMIQSNGRRIAAGRQSNREIVENWVKTYMMILEGRR